MSGEAVTKEELQIMVEVQSKNVEQLTLIAKSLQDMVIKQDKIVTRLYNGMAKDIAESIKESIASLVDTIKDCKVIANKERDSIKLKLGPILDNTIFIKWTTTAVFGLATLVYVIMKLMGI